MTGIIVLSSLPVYKRILLVRCLVPPGDDNQLTITATTISTHNMKDRYVFLTVPRALSRIHHTTRFALKRAETRKE
ncbi:hypothetical protein ABNY15_000563 [Salmonella enterica]